MVNGIETDCCFTACNTIPREWRLVKGSFQTVAFTLNFLCIRILSDKVKGERRSQLAGIMAELSVRLVEK